MCLANPMIGVLPQNDDLDPVERGQIQRPEIFGTLGKDVLASSFFGKQEIFELLHVGAGEFGGKNTFPAVFEFDACLCHVVPLCYLNRLPRCSTSIL